MLKAVAVGYYPPVFRLKLNRPPTYPIRPIIKHNARSSCFTAAAGTCIRRNFSIRILWKNLSTEQGSYSLCLHLPQTIAKSSFRPLFNIPHWSPTSGCGSFSFPLWLCILSDQLLVASMVGLYPFYFTIYLITLGADSCDFASSFSYLCIWPENWSNTDKTEAFFYNTVQTLSKKVVCVKRMPDSRRWVVTSVH